MGTGGARFGAGRPGYRLKAEQTFRVDIREWRKGGYLVNGRTFRWQWARDGKVTGNIGATVFSGSIRLNYSTHGKDALQSIRTTTTPCHYGGSRTWFGCPICHRRAAVLYMRAGRFACRQCQRVSYTSQSGSAHDRAIATYHRLDALLDAGKPKWQRWATFNRLEERFERAEERFNNSLIRTIQRLRCQ